MQLKIVEKVLKVIEKKNLNKRQLRSKSEKTIKVKRKVLSKDQKSVKNYPSWL